MEDCLCAGSGGSNGGPLPSRGPIEAKEEVDVWDLAVDLETPGFAVFLVPAVVGVDGFTLGPDYADISCDCRPVGGFGGSPGLVERSVCLLVALVLGHELVDGRVAFCGGLEAGS